MQFNTKQMREEALLAKGQYHFTVLQAREKVSSNGNEMFIFKLRLDNGHKKFQFTTTLVVMPSMFWRLEHFAAATGLTQKVDSGNLMAQDCDGKEGYLELDHRVNKETGELEAYVKDFLKPELPPEHVDFIDDDIPAFN